MTGRRGHRASARDPEYETQMELAVKDLNDGTYKTINAAANAHKVARQTLSDRVNGTHRARYHLAYKGSQAQRLNEAQETAIHEWRASVQQALTAPALPQPSAPTES